MGGPVSDPGPSPSAAEGYYRGYPLQQAGQQSQGNTDNHTRISGGVAAALVLTVLVVAAVAVLNMVDVAKVIYRPGPIYDTLADADGAPIVAIDGVDTYPTSGELNFTTVLIFGGPRHPVSAWEWLLSELDPTTEVVDEELVYPPDMTSEEVQEQNAELMANSQNSAAVVALRATGVEVPEQIKVAQIIVGAPAAETLEVDDEVLSVGGRPIEGASDVSEALQAYDPGEEVEFELIRDGERLTVRVPTGEDEVQVDDGTLETRTVIGVYLAPDFELPYEVTIDAGNVGGPSAGLMFALAVYDKITEGQLTGGEVFAGTGTLTSTGEVGPISGIRQKMVSSEREGAGYFLAPADNCDDVRGHEPDDLQVIRVATFEEARDAVEGIGAGEQVDLPRC